jgi:hypothetical protein
LEEGRREIGAQARLRGGELGGHRGEARTIEGAGVDAVEGQRRAAGREIPAELALELDRVLLDLFLVVFRAGHRDGHAGAHHGERRADRDDRADAADGADRGAPVDAGGGLDGVVPPAGADDRRRVVVLDAPDRRGQRVRRVRVRAHGTTSVGALSA